MRRCGYLCSMLLGLALVSGCSSELESPIVALSAPQAVVCNPTNEGAQIDDVLVGTDVVSFSTFKVAKVMAAGVYRIEMGGAVSSVNLVQKNKTWQLSRSFNEPGLPISEKTYSITCIDDHQFQGPGITGSATNDGLLILENHSEVEGIPGDLWMLYSANK